MAFYAASAEDLDRLTKVDGASKVETLDAPGGGQRVRLRDPHGFAIEVVHGIAEAAPLPVRRNVVNFGTEKFRRAGELTRLPGGPAQVKRMGHGVIATTDLKKTLAWYRETLGFLCSDDVWAGEPGNLVSSFNRCRRRRDLCRSPRLLHDDRAASRAQSFLVRGARFRRRDDGSRVSRQEKQVSPHVGHRPPPARQPGLRLLVRSVGAACTSIGPTATCSMPPCRRVCANPARIPTPSGANLCRRGSRLTPFRSGFGGFSRIRPAQAPVARSTCIP